MPYEWKGFLQRRHPHRLDAEKYRIPGQTVLITACTSERRPILLDARGVIIAALDPAADTHGCGIIAWCLMPEYIHILVRVAPDGGDILRFIHGFKTWTGRMMREAGFGRSEQPLRMATANGCPLTPPATATSSATLGTSP